MNIKEIVEGMTAPQVAQVIKDNFNEVDKDKANKTDLNKSISDLESVVEANKTDLNKSISDLSSVVEANKTDLTKKIDNNKNEADAKLSELESETDTKLSELGSKINYHFVKEGVGTYSKFNVSLKKGALITNNGVYLVFADNSSLVGRRDVAKGETILLESDKNFMQTTSEEGLIDFSYQYNATKEEFEQERMSTEASFIAVNNHIEEVKNNTPHKFVYTTTETYKKLPLSKPLLKGTRIKNNGIAVIVADDSALTNRIDLGSDQSVLLYSDKSHLQTANVVGDVNLDIQYLFEGMITEREISPFSIGEKSLSIIVPANFINPSIFKEGHYYVAATNRYLTNASYDCTGEIAIRGGKPYTANRNARFWAFRNSKGQYEEFGDKDANTKIVAPTWAETMIVTFYKSENYSIVEDTAWSDYGNNDKKILSPLLIPKAETLSVSRKALFADKTLAKGDVVVTPQIHICKDITISALVEGDFEDVQIGLALNGTYGRNLQISQNSIIVRGGVDDSTKETINFDLPITNKMTISMSRGNNDMKVIICNERGDSFTQEFGWGQFVGMPFFKNNGSTELSVKLVFYPRDISKDIWMFGDSYFGMYDASRWPYHILQWGFDNFLIDARGGEYSAESLVDLTNLLEMGNMPKYIVWCLGMNRGGDTDDNVNTAWLSDTESVLALCEKKGITPILATIPSVPTQIHTKLNEWVRNSGYRFIDFANAVESESDYYWKGWGTENSLLSSDEVHPNERGAVVLAHRVLVDFPEISNM